MHVMQFSLHLSITFSTSYYFFSPLLLLSHHPSPMRALLVNTFATDLVHPSPTVFASEAK
jgi:hypothetical protein